MTRVGIIKRPSRWTSTVWSALRSIHVGGTEGWDARLRAIYIAFGQFSDTQLALQLLDLLIFDLDEIQEHLVLLARLHLIILLLDVLLDSAQLRSFQLNHLGCMSLLHVNLSLSEGMHLIHIVFILRGEVLDFLIQLLNFIYWLLYRVLSLFFSFIFLCTTLTYLHILITCFSKESGLLLSWQ